MSEIPASIQNITPTCRAQRGAMGALREAFDRIEASYAGYVHDRDNHDVTWRVSLVRVDTQ